MISFKAFNEKYVQGRKEWALMGLGALPITPWFLKELTMDVPVAFRVSNINSLRDMYKYQHQKKQLSTFTKGSMGLSGGAMMRTEVLVQLSGKTVFANLSDSRTELDRNGTKWLLPIFSKAIIKDFTIPMIKKMYTKYLPDEVKSLNNVDSEYMKYGAKMKDLLFDFNGKEKRDFIQWWYKEAKKLITPGFIKKVQNVIRSKDTTFDNDEILLHDYEIIHIWHIDEIIMGTFIDQNNDYYDMYMDFVSDDIEAFIHSDPRLESAFNKYLKKTRDIYPDICMNFISRKDIENIDVKKGKYPKTCK